MSPKIDKQVFIQNVSLEDPGYLWIAQPKHPCVSKDKSLRKHSQSFVPSASVKWTQEICEV